MFAGAMNSRRSWVPLPPSGLVPGLALDLRGKRALQSGSDASLAAILSVVRATTALDEQPDGSLVSVANHVARYGGGRGLLVERGATNLCLQSAGFATAPWTNAGATVTANAIIAPDGTLTADQLDITATAGLGRYQVITVTPSTVYTLSWYSKLGSLPLANATYALRDDTAAAFIAFDQPINPATNADTWTRTTVTVTTPVGCTSLRIYPLRSNSASPAAGSIFPWGVQVETGPKATAYIPTTTVAVTRNADQVKVTGAPLTAGIGTGAAFSMFMEYEAYTSFDSSYLYQFANDGSPDGNESIRAFLSTSRALSLQVMQAAANTFTITTATANAPPTLNRLAMRAVANDTAISHNGAVPIQDGTVTMPTPSLTRLMLGSAAAFPGTQAINGRVTRFAAWPSLLSDADLRGIV